MQYSDARRCRPDPAHHRFGAAHRQAHSRRATAGGGGRSTLHSMDACGRSKRGTANLPGWKAGKSQKKVA
jgi:hypothetical protein